MSSGLTIETSAIGRYTTGLSVTDRDRLWKVIDKGVGLWRCEHKITEPTPTRLAVVLQRINKDRIHLQHLKNLVESWGPWVRQITLWWSHEIAADILPQDGLGFCISIEIDRNEEHDIGNPDRSGNWRKIQFKELAEEAVEHRARPHDWDIAVERMSRLSHVIHNRKEFVPAHLTNLDVHPNQRCYTMSVTQMDNIDYDLLVAISSVVNIMDITAYASDRRLAIRLTSTAPLAWDQLGQAHDEDDAAPRGKNARLG